MQTTKMPILKISNGEIEKRLEYFGWHRSVAGDEDFDKAVKAIVAMYGSGRGLFITGDAGCGKTALMSALKKIMGRGGECWFYCKEPDDISALRGSTCDALEDSVFIDDIGSEEILREYGNTVDVVGDFVQRYHYRGKRRFLATTNLDGKGINERYGGRVVDRINEMCVVLHLSGKSKRERIVFK